MNDLFHLLLYVSCLSFILSGAVAEQSNNLRSINEVKVGTPCAPGYFDPTNGTANHYNPCRPCQRGAYQPNSGASTCISCPINTNNTKEGSKSITDCLSCPPGTYNSANGVGINYYSCVPCNAGSYNENFGSPNCTLCPPYTYNNATGSTSSSSCNVCPLGTYNNAARKKEPITFLVFNVQVEPMDPTPLFIQTIKDQVAQRTNLIMDMLVTVMMRMRMKMNLSMLVNIGVALFLFTKRHVMPMLMLTPHFKYPHPLRKATHKRVIPSMVMEITIVDAKVPLNLLHVSLALPTHTV